VAAPQKQDPKHDPRRANAGAGDRLRERFRHAVRDSLLEAAERSIVEDGVEGASLQSIARRAGVAVGTIYNHFNDRQELFSELFGMRRIEVFATIDAAMKAAQKGSFEVQLEAFARALLGFYDQRREFMRVVFASDTLKLQMMCDKSGRFRPFLHELQSRAERIMGVGVRERRVVEDDVELLASVFTSILRGVVATRLEQGVRLADAAPRVVELFCQGASRSK
jgi:AcrR family transcriptional regulator